MNKETISKVVVQKVILQQENGKETLEFITFQETMNEDPFLVINDESILNSLIEKGHVTFVGEPTIDYIGDRKGKIKLITQEIKTGDMMILESKVNSDGNEPTIKVIEADKDEDFKVFQSLKELEKWVTDYGYSLVEDSVISLLSSFKVYVVFKEGVVQ
ncbi:hypothetical protein P9X10_01375 [Bacillus cereus]|nr:hypothetical protein [Bacillus cereus]